MLIEFRVENFRSIKNEVCLSMIPSSIRNLSDNLIDTKMRDPPRLLKSAVLIGQNASGKTNVLFAFETLKQMILSSDKHNVGDKLPYTPFKLNTEFSTKPTHFIINFIVDNCEHQYELVHNSERILKEKLVRFTKIRRERIIFIREKEFEFGVDPEEQEVRSKQTPENVLYLSRASSLGYEPIRRIFSWFKDVLYTIGPTDLIHTDKTIAFMNQNSKCKTRVLQALKNADLDIQDITARTRKYKEEELKDAPDIFREILLEKGSVDLKTFHQPVGNNAGEPIKFDFFSEESDGTQKFFHLLGPLFNTLKKGRIIVIDELDVKLHPGLQNYLIRMFHDPEMNNKGAQLIFTSHSVVFLDDIDVFRTDQIWITDKQEDKSTSLISLHSYAERSDRRLFRKYMLGKFGGLPHLGDERIPEDTL